MSFSEFFTEQEAYDLTLQYATDAHEGQTRKFNGEPYINHPVAVAELVQQYDNRLPLVQAALLHDTIEDTDVTYNELVNEFGKEVAELVFELTSPDIKDKSKKGEILAKKMSAMSNDALTIKLADRLNNVSDFDTAPKSFVRGYKPETDYILSNLNRELSPIQLKLVNAIKEKIKNY